ncbi:MAG: PQQ-binding-like beta-propeller repeat protein [Thermoguttaceae bacterium]
MRKIVRLAAMTVIAFGPLLASGENWPCFRGPDGSGVSSETGLPTTWSDSEHVAWKHEMPGPGSSSPITWGDRVFVTCYSGYGVDPDNPGDQHNLKRHLVCLNLGDGKVLWQKAVPAKLPESPYEGQLTQHGYATSTPVTDGERIFVFFGKSGVIAFDWNGNQLWQANVGARLGMMNHGSGASLVLCKDLVIVNANAESESLAALDKRSGRQIWKTDAKGYNGSFSTPVLLEKSGGKYELIVHMPDEIWALSPTDGGMLWFCTGVRGDAIPAPAIANGIVFGLGRGGTGSGFVAIRAGGRDDVTAKNVLWRSEAASQVPSPVALGDYLYWVDEHGAAYCLRADTGQRVYRSRLPKAGEVYASPVAADGKLFAVTRRNGTFVLDAKPEFKLLAHNKLASDPSIFNASPAISQGRLLLRSDRFVYCISSK